MRVIGDDCPMMRDVIRLAREALATRRAFDALTSGATGLEAVKVMFVTLPPLPVAARRQSPLIEATRITQRRVN